MAKTILTPLQQTFLSLLVQNKTLTKRFYLSGGTALSEFYLQHRLSEDIDLFSEQEFSLIPIQTFLKKISKNIQVSKIEYRNFMGLHTFFLHQNQNILKVDFNFYPFLRVEKGKEFAGLSVDSLLDIAVNKLQTIATQPRSRDFIDLYCIMQKTDWTIDFLRKFARVKFDYFTDSLHLGSRFLMVLELKDYPKMIKALDNQKCQNFFVEEARRLEKEVIKK